jgi:hypothetical protein
MWYRRPEQDHSRFGHIYFATIDEVFRSTVKQKVDFNMAMPVAVGHYIRAMNTKTKFVFIALPR